jgi:uncharacterized protein YkwD
MTCRRRCHRLLVTGLPALLCLLSTGASRADALAALNLARSSRCAAAPLPSLQHSTRLDAVAARLALGTTLHTALIDARYRVSTAASLHLAGVSSDAATSRVLASRSCRDFGDRALREAGVARRGPDIWIVVAAPLRAPGPAESGAVAARVLDLVNLARASGRRCGRRYYGTVPPLALAPALTTAALEHANDMARHSRFEHQGRDGSMASNRVRRAGYRSRIVGENIAAGVATPEDAVAGWLASPGHCTNIMDPRYTHMGVAYAENVASESAVYWAQVLAAAR